MGRKHRAARPTLEQQRAQWLISKFNEKARAEGKPPGWMASRRANQIFDGLTLQIYAELLRPKLKRESNCRAYGNRFRFT